MLCTKCVYEKYIYLIYSSEHKDQNDVKKKSKCEITFYFKKNIVIMDTSYLNENSIHDSLVLDV